MVHEGRTRRDFMAAAARDIPGKILACFEDVMTTGGKGGRVPEYWDGKAAERIAAVLADWAGARRAA